MSKISSYAFIYNRTKTPNKIYKIVYFIFILNLYQLLNILNIINILNNVDAFHKNDNIYQDKTLIL